MTERKPKEETVEAVARQQSIPGPPEKLGRIFDEHHAVVFRAAYRITGDASDAEDVLQTVFVRLLQLERGGALSESPGPYLHRAAVNVALDVVRDRRARRSTPLEEVAPRLVADRQPGPERGRQDQELRARVREVLAEFSPKMAEIFVLRYFEGYDNHEIARMLRTSRSTVAVLLHRARGRLKNRIRTFAGELP